MALTITKDEHPVTGSDRIALGGAYLVTGSIAYDDSYTEGGEPVEASDFGLGIGESVILHLSFEPPTDGANYSAFDKANGKVKLFTADGTEAVDATDQSAVEQRFLALVA